MIDVLVIGAGPTGLMMAALAARFGMSCRIVDKILKPSDQSRALAIQPRTLEIFDHLGIVEPFLEKGLKIRAARQISGQKQLVSFSFNSLKSPYPFVLSLEQSHTEKILSEYLTSFGVQVERGVELFDIQETDEKVLGICQNTETGKEEIIEAKWAVGCDGAHSIVRKKLGFSFIGKAFPSAFSLADVKIKWRYPHDELVVFLNPEGIMAAIPMPEEERYRLVFQLERCRDLPEYSEVHGQMKTVPDPTLEEVLATLQKHGDAKAKVTDPLWLANFHINSRLVESYQKGKIFIAGDAAHIHSPAGGQGMNSGLQDAFNLAWKLASGKRELIDTYTLERRSWGKNLLRTTHVFTKIATWHNPMAVAVRNKAIQMIAPWIKRRVIEAIAQISIQYPKSPIVSESGSFYGGPRAGMRAPSVPVGESDLYSVMRKSKGHHLLVFGGSGLREFEIREMAVVEMDHPAAWQEYGVKKEGVYLIRPDQYVGHRSSPIDKQAIQAYYQTVL